VLHFDVRWIHAAAILASVWLFYAADNRKEIAACFGSVFLLIPYLLYRHEVYLGILWLNLSLVYFFEQKDRPILSSIFAGVAAATSQFAWVLAPFYLLGIYKRSGWKKAATGLVFCIASFLAIVLPFVIQRPANFYDGVFAHWSHTFNATTFNFSYFLLIPFSTSNLKVFQAAAIVFFFWKAWKSTPERRYEWMTYALLSFILLNPLIWVYFYLTLFVLMICSARVPRAEL